MDDKTPSAPGHDAARNEPAELLELRSLLARTKQGDQSALPRLREILDGHPEVWGWYGNLAIHVESAYINLVSGTDLGLAETLRRKVAALRDELAGPGPKPIDRLLAERVAACWLQLHWAEAMVAQAREVSVKQAELALRRVNAAHRRYLTALGALATVKRLVPAPKQPAPLANSDVAPRVAVDTEHDQEAAEEKPPRESSASASKGRAKRASRPGASNLVAVNAEDNKPAGPCGGSPPSSASRAG
jgi:hypothetical protein